MVGGFILAAVSMALFILAERRSPAPLLRLDLFANRAFAINSIVTVLGMFAYLGTAYSTSIRLAAIQGFSPLKTSIAFVLLNCVALLLLPVTSRVLEKYNPKWPLGIGLALTAIADLWLSQISATDHAISSIVVPLLLAGIGFAFSMSAVTAVAVNTVPNHLAGMASGSTSMLRDFGFTLGPAVIGAIALSRAATEVQTKVSGSPTLQKALAAFDGSVAHVPAAQRPAVEAAVGAVHSGPLGANAVPATVKLPTGQTVPFNPLKNVAFHALDHAYSIGYLVCGVCALLAGAIAFFALGGRSDETMISEESLA